MDDEKLTNEERANRDKLDFFFNEKIKVHLILKRKLKSTGKNVWINGMIVRAVSDRLWVIEDSQLGEVRVSIYEIASDGVNEFTEVRG